MSQQDLAIDVTAKARRLPAARLEALCQRQQEELGEQEPVITAAILAAAAFRMKEERGLVSALRRLALAVDRMDAGRADD